MKTQIDTTKYTAAQQQEVEPEKGFLELYNKHTMENPNLTSENARLKEILELEARGLIDVYRKDQKMNTQGTYRDTYGYRKERRRCMDGLQADNTRLRSLNAELLAALKRLENAFALEECDAHAEAKAAIAKAEREA